MHQKQTSATDYLSNASTTAYTKSGVSTVITNNAADGGSSITTIGALGEKLEVREKAVTGSYVEQNGWGEKTKLTDPSAGIYTYDYDGWGQLTEETTPKGTITYTYDAAGKLTAKTLIGDATNMAWTYAYDGTTKLPTLTTLVNADGNNTTYTYTYDGYKRLSGAAEDNPYATFASTYTYDGYGRLGNRGQSATDKQSSIAMSKGVIMSYQNGQLLEMILDGHGQSLWKAESLDTRGMLASFKQGDSILTSLIQDSYGYPQTGTFSRISTSPATLMTLGYTFNASRGFPTVRSNSAFGWSESFSYDNLDRLTVFNDNNGSHNQAYDARGRISSNSRLGTYTYSGTSYQQSGLNLNTPADLYYQSREEQNISYNAFKSPVEIHEPGHDRYSFQYNGELGRANMFYGSEAADMLLRPLRRHYSSDGSVEITKDLTAGTTGFVFYLGGDAYTAPAIWKETHSASPTLQQFFYLHRDYLGSIVLISNAYGYTVEKRQFDAWGNIVRLQDGANNNLSNFTVIDRGFTGHEHLLPVGLIHMNARLYDPLLGRFLAPDNYVQDPFGTQNFNRYGYALNNPLVYVDPNGEFLHIIVGAAIGGVINVIVKAIDGDIDGLGAALKAFGVGTVAGGVTAATGGAALAATGLAGGSILGGALIGATGFTTGGLIQNVGNHLAFGDPLMSAKEFATGALLSTVTGGVLGGVTNLISGKGTNLWTGRLNSRVEVEDLVMTRFGNRDIPIEKSTQLSSTSSATKTVPTVAEQAAAISKQVGKNSISIRTPNKTLHFDLQGATHKGVPTPHVQQSLPNVNPKTGQVFWNKDRQWVQPMTQQDIRIIRNYLKRQ